MPADAKIAGIAIAHEELGLAAALLGRKCSDFAATGQFALNKTSGRRRDLVRFVAGSVDYLTF